MRKRSHRLKNRQICIQTVWESITTEEFIEFFYLAGEPGQSDGIRALISKPRKAQTFCLIERIEERHRYPAFCFIDIVPHHDELHNWKEASPHKVLTLHAAVVGEQPLYLRSPFNKGMRRLGARVPGVALWIHTILALEQLGLNPKRDNISILPIGDPSQVMQALEDGRIDGAVLSRAQSRQLAAKGYAVLFDFAPANLYGAQDALVSTAAFSMAQAMRCSRW